MHSHLFWIFFYFNIQLAGLSLQTEDVFSKVDDLNSLCPYTSFCHQNASSYFPYGEQYQPCCKSCSCEPDCGLHGDCCFSKSDIYYTKNTSNVLCRSAFVVEPPKKDIPEAVLYRYRMINSCGNNIIEGDMYGVACENISSNALESFYPLVSRRTNYIYVNARCAECNNVTDAVPWRRMVTCSSEAETSLSESVESFVKGKHSVVTTGCYIYYIPPAGFDLSQDESCNPFVIRTCLKDFHTKHYKELCEKFNATFTISTGNDRRSYANIYCFLCRTAKGGNSSVIKNKQCLKSEFLYSSKLLSDTNRLTALLEILDTETDQEIDEEPPTDRKKRCPASTTLVRSFTHGCRPLKCPWGQIRLNNRCGYYSTMWIGGPFSMVLRLTPVQEKMFLHRSFFEHRNEHDRTDSQARWIIRKTLKRWDLLVFYHTERNKPTVDYLVVVALYSKGSVHPEHLKKMVDNVRGDIWQIHYMNLTFEYRVDLNKYFKYDVTSRASIRNMGINIKQPFGLYPTWATCYRMDLKNNYYDEFLYPFSHVTSTELANTIPITKLFFCNQVDLLPSEYEYKCSDIFFKVKNITIYMFDVVKLSEFAVNGDYKHTVRVCLDEFEQIQLNASVSSNYGISTLISSGMLLLITRLIL